MNDRRGKTPEDQAARTTALDATRSLLVQAPAGSGKTGLLVRRFLVLLARVQKPEEILAITFTRKAAAEMRARIIDALQPHAADPQLRELAAAALANDAKQEWQILRHPRRLRIQTIDSVCAELVRRMPWSARFGAPPSIVEAPELLYARAAAAAMAQLEQRDSRWAAACRQLLELVDANLWRAQTLLADMLVKRDKWMRVLPQLNAQPLAATRAILESAWQNIVQGQLDKVEPMLSPAQQAESIELAAYAAAQLAAESPAPANDAAANAANSPPPELAHWHTIAGLLLTTTDTLRTPRGVTIRQGFATGTPQKKRLQALLGDLAAQSALVDNLALLRQLPEGRFSDEQWQSLTALFTLLPLAVAELQLLFTESNQADYIEIAQRAERALYDNDSDQPSDLALVFDYRLQHLLVDEFQDTSAAQIDLIKQLTAGWSDGDGRSVFFVGDPMQSIYLFRQAEVGHFLEVQENGLGDLSIEPLFLTSNFRSAPKLVDWFNDAFARVMPAANDPNRGAVKYSPATPFLDTDPTAEVTVHAECDRDAAAEAAAITELITQLKAETAPEHRIAVLGRTRGHLSTLAETLRRHGIAYQAIELQKLAHTRPILDLLALTRALLQPADRLAWLGLLRATWCGMTLADITRLSATAPHQTIGELWCEQSRLSQLSADGRERLQRLKQAIGPALARQGHIHLRDNVEAAWLNLGGATSVNATELADCRDYFDLLEQLQDAGIPLSPQSLDAALERFWAKPASDAALQLLTIHKAKGLEFDTVILPGLEKSAGRPETPLLRWTRLPQELLLAPLPAKPARHAPPDSFYRYLGQLEKQQRQNELCRLLYVACTRARQQLHLFANVKTRADGSITPAANSFLQLLWPVLEPQLEQARTAAGTPPPAECAGAHGRIKIPRLPLHWQPPQLPADITVSTAAETKPAAATAIEFSWAGEVARVTGIIVHLELQQIDNIGWPHWHTQPIDAQRERVWQQQLAAYPLDAAGRAQALAQVKTALENTQRDARAEWIFSAAHAHIQTEWALSYLDEDRVVHLVIDRSFIDAAATRWIIDFKSSRHEQPDVAAFMQQERSRYEDKMHQYAAAVAALGQPPQKIKLGLYFPMFNGWCEWAYPA